MGSLPPPRGAFITICYTPLRGRGSTTRGGVRRPSWWGSLTNLPQNFFWGGTFRPKQGSRNAMFNASRTISRPTECIWFSGMVHLRIFYKIFKSKKKADRKYENWPMIKIAVSLVLIPCFTQILKECWEKKWKLSELQKVSQKHRGIPRWWMQLVGFSR